MISYLEGVHSHGRTAYIVFVIWSYGEYPMLLYCLRLLGLDIPLGFVNVSYLDC
jgi:hypothetical protein